MTEEDVRIDAVVHKREDIPVKKFDEGITLRRIGLTTVAQTWIEMKKGLLLSASPPRRRTDGCPYQRQAPCAKRPER